MGAYGTTGYGCLMPDACDQVYFLNTPPLPDRQPRRSVKNARREARLIRHQRAEANQLSTSPYTTSSDLRVLKTTKLLIYVSV
jgi:hypothetical protein